jgi:uncharacterized protein
MATANGKGSGAKEELTLNRQLMESQIRLNDAAAALGMTRATFMRRALDGKRDLDTECGYPDVITTSMYKVMFDRNDIAARVVEVFPDESWKVDPEIYEDENEDTETTFEAAVKTLVRDLNVYSYLHRGDILSGIGEFGVILLGFDDGKNLSEPVDGVDAERIIFEPEIKKPVSQQQKEDGTERRPPFRGGDPQEPPDDSDAEATEVPEAKRKLLYMRVFDQSFVTVSKYETDQNNPRHGRPVLYQVTMGDVTKGFTETTNTDVHWTRIIHLADNCEGNEVYGKPRMKSVFNRLLDVRKLLGGSAEMFWKGAFPGYSFEVNPDIASEVVFDDKVKQELRGEFANFSNGLERFMATKGVAVKSLSPQVSEPTAHLDAQINAICVKLTVPRRVFEGSERGELASSQDSESWDKRMERRQDKYNGPCIVRPFYDRLIMAGVLPMPENPAGYKCWWPPLSKPSDTEQAEVAAKITEALAKYVAGGVATLVPPLEYMTNVLKMKLEVAQAILKAADTQIEETQDETDSIPNRTIGNPDREREQQVEEQERLMAAKKPPGE